MKETDVIAGFSKALISAVVVCLTRLCLRAALRADLSREREAEGPVTRHGPGAGGLEAAAGEGHAGTLSSGRLSQLKTKDS